jgi:hypothetical protein
MHQTTNRCAFLAFALSAVYALSCRGLPSNFSELPLSEQVATYEKYAPGSRGGSLHARVEIAKHGLAAADAMIPYLREERAGFPREEAMLVILEVQLRGCTLRGTRAHLALMDLRRGSIQPRDLAVAERVLESIELDSHEQGNLRRVVPHHSAP